MGEFERNDLQHGIVIEIVQINLVVRLLVEDGDLCRRGAALLRLLGVHAQRVNHDHRHDAQKQHCRVETAEAAERERTYIKSAARHMILMVFVMGRSPDRPTRSPKSEVLWYRHDIHGGIVASNQ